MTVPLVSLAQVRILSEGLAEPTPPFEPMPPELAPTLRFTEEQIRKGLPAPGPFTRQDLRCCRFLYDGAEHPHTKRVFFEMP
jgi:hypothetical protein